MEGRFVRPDKEDLLPCQRATCTVQECGKTFLHQRALHWHQVKTHKLIKNDRDNALLKRHKLEPVPDEPCKYYCPEKSCWYYDKGPFSSMKRLKEHYINVHAEKKYVCPNCQTGFGYERALKRHRTTVCGMTYNCGGCVTEFASKTAMLTHCKKRKHTVGRLVGDRYNASPIAAEPTTTVDEPSKVQTRTSSTETMTECRDNTLNTVFESGTSSQTCNAGEIVGKATTCDMAVGPDSQDTDNGISNDVRNSQTSTITVDTATQVVGPENIETAATATSHGNIVTNSATCSTNLPNVTVPASAVPPVVVVNVMQVFCADPSLSPYIKGKNGQRLVLPNAKIEHKDSFHGPITSSTQTSGDYILERAMTKARIPTKKVSTGSQASPKNRQKSPKSTRSTCVQTKKRKKLSTSKPAPLPSVDDLFCLSDVETQTNMLIEELQASLGASISTQTKDSFLATNNERPPPYVPMMPIHQQPSPIIPFMSEVPNVMTDNFVLPNPHDFPPLSHFHLEPGFHSNQTQTMDSMFEQLLNNMETQTPFTDFGFGIDNETQTVAPQSVETQTSLHGRVQIGSNVESTSIETQTMATDFDPSLFEFAQLISGMQ